MSPTPYARFSHFYLELVGTLPLSSGCSYLLICVDRFTWWLDAIILPGFAATVYPLAANGLVEQFHRQLKAFLRAADDPEKWTDHLPLDLLGICSSLKSDLDCSVAELVFGATVRLPSQMETLRFAVEDPTNLLHCLWQFMRSLSPVPPRSFVSKSCLEKELAACPHVYLRCDRVGRPLEPPSDGLFRVISRGTKNFRILFGTREEVVIVERLKAAIPNTPPDEPCGPLLPAPPPRPSIPPSPIPPNLACEVLRKRLEEAYDETQNVLKIEQLMRLFEFCQQTFFTFAGETFKQIKGTPMGSPVSG
nr:unnamed protein product [Spirometra erinaceieuropaei]